MIKTWLVVGFAVMMMGCANSRPARVGVTNGQLMACPASPNCVCSQATDKEHAIAPLTYQGTAEDALSRLLALIRDTKRTTVVTAQERYLHVEFRSAFFRFVDDVEFHIDDAQKTIHFRSASRLGSSDFGVNRKRMEAIRQRFEKMSS